MNTLDPEFLDRVDRYWADFLGCAPDMLRRETPQVVGHAALDDYAGCYLMEFGGAPIVSLPIDEVESYRQAVAQWRPGIVRTPAVVEAVFGKGVTGSIGPAFVGYCDLKHFRPVPTGAARPLTARDEKAVDTLRAACVIEEWNHGGNQFRPSAVRLSATNLRRWQATSSGMSKSRISPLLLTRPFAGMVMQPSQSVG
jgi:hypothetical protein